MAAKTKGYQLIALLRRGIEEPAKLGRILSLSADDVREEIETLRASGAMPVLTTGQRARAKRNLEMAEMVKSGKSVLEVAGQFQKSEEIVRAACRLHEVEIPPAAGGGKDGKGNRKPTVGAMKVVAALIEREAGRIAAASGKGDSADTATATKRATGKAGRPQDLHSLSEIARELKLQPSQISMTRKAAEEAGIFAAVEKVKRAAVKASKKND